MTRYELLYIIPATHAETELQPVIDSVTSVLTKFGAKIVRNDMVGKLKLAYPVAHIRHGYYIIVDMDVETSKVAEIDNALRLNTEVIRHQLMVKDPKVKPVFKIASVEDIERDKARGTVAREVSTRQAAAAPKSDKKVEVNLADLDQKLDKIVEGKIL
jgi:small subunit ribosomal protein S6